MQVQKRREGGKRKEGETRELKEGMHYHGWFRALILQSRRGGNLPIGHGLWFLLCFVHGSNLIALALSLALRSRLMPISMHQVRIFSKVLQVPDSLLNNFEQFFFKNTDIKVSEEFVTCKGGTRAIEELTATRKNSH